MFNVNQLAELMKPAFLNAIALGKVEGAIGIRKFSFCETLPLNTRRDVWDYGSTTLGNRDYIYSTDDTAPIDSMSSSSAADDGFAVIVGLDVGGLLVSQTIAIDGQTQVPLTTPLWRVFRVQYHKATTLADRGAGLAGILYIYEDTVISAGVPVDTDKVRAIVNNGDNQTQMSQFATPANSSSLLLGGGSYVANKQAASIVNDVYVRTMGSVFRRVNVTSINSLGSGNDFSPQLLPGLLPGLSDIVVTATADGAGVAASNNYTLIIFDNDMWDLTGA